MQTPQNTAHTHSTAHTTQHSTAQHSRPATLHFTPHHTTPHHSTPLHSTPTRASATQRPPSRIGSHLPVVVAHLPVVGEPVRPAQRDLAFLNIDLLQQAWHIERCTPATVTLTHSSPHKQEHTRRHTGTHTITRGAGTRPLNGELLGHPMF